MTAEPPPDSQLRTLLDLLAVAGHPVPALVLSQLPELAPEPAHVLDDAERQGLIAVIGGRAELRTGALDDAGGPGRSAEPGLLRRAELRAVLGRALTGVTAVPGHVVAAHRLAGLLARPDPEAVPHALAVAHQILRTGDLDDAIGLFRQILDALDQGAEPASARVSALGGLASALAWAGRADEGGALLAAATDVALSSGDGDQLAAAALLWENRAIAVDDDPANVALIDRALEALGHGAWDAAGPSSSAHVPDASGPDAGPAEDEPPDQRRAIVVAQLLGLRANRLIFADLAAARALSADALARARSTGHAATIVANAYCRRLAIWHPASHDEVMELATEMVRLSTATSAYPEFGTVTRLQVFFEQGDFAHFDNELRALGRRVAYQRGRFERVWLDTFQAARALIRGNWATTTHHIAAARALTTGVDYAVLDQLLLAQEMLMSWHQGADLSTLVTGDALPAGPMREAWMACLLGLSADRLDQSALEAGLLRHLGHGIGQVRQDLTWGPVTACLSLAAVAARSTTHALILTEALTPYASHWAATGGAVSFGPVAWHLGGLAHVLGRRDEARHQLERALGQCREAEAEPWTARVHLSLAALDGPDKSEHLQAALVVADRLGLAPVTRAARQLAPAGSRPARPAGLTEREVDVLVLLAEGLTNREIAARLYLSVKTVERHLLNTYTKIEVKNRSEATAFALRHDLTAR